MAYLHAKNSTKTAAAKKPRDPLYVGCFRVIMTDSDYLTPETPAEAQERERSEHGKKIAAMYHGTVIRRRAYQFFVGEGVTGIDFALMTVTEFGEFCNNKTWKYRFASERDGYSYAVVKLYRRPPTQAEQD